MPSTANATNSRTTSMQPSRPSSSPMMAKMKSVCAFGRNSHLARPCPRPTPVHPPLPSAISDCVIWYPVFDASAAGFRNTKMRARRYGSAIATIVPTSAATPPMHARCRSRTPPATRMAPTMSASTTVESRSGSTTTSAAIVTNTSPIGLQRAPPVAELVLAAGEEVGAEHEQRELGDLGRLEPQRADAEPAARPADRDPDAGDQHEQQQRRPTRRGAAPRSRRHAW